MHFTEGRFVKILLKQLDLQCVTLTEQLQSDKEYL